jgi:hypothetical protein
MRTLDLHRSARRVMLGCRSPARDMHEGVRSDAANAREPTAGTWAASLIDATDGEIAFTDHGAWPMER